MQEKMHEENGDNKPKYEYSPLNSEERRQFDHFINIPLAERSVEAQETCVRLTARRANVRRDLTERMPDILQKPVASRTEEEKEILYLVELSKRHLHEKLEIIEAHPTLKNLIEDFAHRAELFPRLDKEEREYLGELNASIRVVSEQIFS